MTSSQLVLLFTRDGDFARLVYETLFPADSVLLIARDVRSGLQIVYERGRELDLAVMDLVDDGCRGRTLLSAVHTCYERLPIVVTTSDGAEDACFLAYANGARSCLKKPLSPVGFAQAISDVTDCAPPLSVDYEPNEINIV